MRVCLVCKVLVRNALQNAKGKHCRLVGVTKAQLLLSDDHTVIEAYRIEIALVDILKRIYYHTKRIARRI